MSLRWRWWALWWALAAWMPTWAADTADTCVPRVLAVQAARSDDGARPVQGWEPVKLPDVWTWRWPGHGGSAWYRIDWERSCADGTPVALGIDRISVAGEVFSNGDLLWRDASLVEPLSRSWNVPRWWLLPASGLQSGVNTVWVRAVGPAALSPGLGALRVGVGAQAAGGLGQYREQRGFGVGQLGRGFPQVRPTGRRHALQGSAKRCAVEVEVENFVLGQVPFQLRRAPQLAQLAEEGARVRIKQARDLHRQGAAAGYHPRAREVLPGCARQCQRVYAGVRVEPAVFVGEQRIEVIRRDFTGVHRVAPDAVGVGEAPEGCAVFGEDDAGQIVLGQRQWPNPVSQPQQRNNQHHGSQCAAQ